MMRQTILFLLAILTGSFCSQANAGNLIFTETVTGSGVLDGTAFSNALVTLAGTIDSSTYAVDNSIGLASVFLTPDATVTVGGVTDTLTGHSLDPSNGSQFNGPFEVDATSLTEVHGVYLGADVEFSTVVLILSTSSMSANYASALEVGAISGQAGADVAFQFATASGAFFQLDSTSGSSTVTIAGGAASVPEPGSLVLACLGTVGVGLGASRKRRDRKGLEDLH
jgi:hypothetical protein